MEIDGLIKRLQSIEHFCAQLQRNRPSLTAGQALT
jgi:hypothetical protein